MNGPSPVKEKDRLRKLVKEQLQKMTSQAMNEESRKISEKILNLPQWTRARIVLAYLPFQGEYDPTLVLNEALARGKALALPRLENRTTSPSLGRDMEFHRVAGLDGPWESHPFGMREPPASFPVLLPEEYTREEIFVLTPGLAFDRKGFRLGRGGGYYDTYIQRFPGRLTLVAPAFTCQIVDSVPAEPHDRPLDLVVSPVGILYPDCP